LWAYGFVTAGKPGEKAAMPGPPARTLRKDETPEEQTRKRRVEGSDQAYSLQEIRNGNDVADWFPGDHPAMTPIMQHGPASLGEKAYGCAFCHLPNGRGKPENAPVSGLPMAYFVRQLQDMRKGDRTSAEPRKANTLLMIALAQAMTDAEMKEAAAYFAAMPWTTKWIRVVETERVPRTKIVSGMFVPIEAEHTEPLAGRIIEVPENAEQTEALRNPRSSFIAYVPFGSVKKGEALVRAGGGRMIEGKQEGGKTLACITCHGPDLNGLAEVPGIAGRSPSYLVRQLYDIQHGTRKSDLSKLMLPVVANLTSEDLVAIGAYLGSLEP
jgi:cytochrome c553